MRGVVSLWRLTVGKKIVMALTGAVLLLFVLGHMFGNLKIYLGPEHYDAYASGLRTLGVPIFGNEWLLWIARVVLLGCVILHVVAAAQLYALSLSAREVGYRKQEPLAFSFASSTMRWGGLTLAAFILFHLAHLTWGWIDPGEYVAGDPYHNVVAGFQHWWLSALYIVAMVPLCFHIYHGAWSACQTLGINNPRFNGWRRPFALFLAAVVFVGNVSIPVAIMAGLVR